MCLACADVVFLFVVVILLQVKFLVVPNSVKRGQTHYYHVPFEALLEELVGWNTQRQGTLNIALECAATS